MTDNVINLPIGIRLPSTTLLDTPPERVLKGAADADLESLIIVGRQKGGGLYFASTSPEAASVLWDLEVAKGVLMKAEVRS